MARPPDFVKQRFSSHCPGCGGQCEWETMGVLVEAGAKIQSHSRPFCENLQCKDVTPESVALAL